MAIDRSDMNPILLGFLIYHETILGHSKRTVDEYYLDLRRFLRFLKARRGLPSDTIRDVTNELLASVTLTDVYAFVNQLSRDGLGVEARYRKIATLRSFYKYLSVKAHLLDHNPLQDLDSPLRKATLPKYLKLDEAQRLLAAVDGKNQIRDYCILTLFLNCGMRLSELSGLNLNNIQDDRLHILGKGNKERILYLNDACQVALRDYLQVRPSAHTPALFLSERKRRIANSTIQYMLQQTCIKAGLPHYSPHKLRHTAATLMMDNGVDVRTLQEVLGHEHLNTTQIYTHVSNENLKQAAQANPLAHVQKQKLQ